MCAHVYMLFAPKANVSFAANTSRTLATACSGRFVASFGIAFGFRLRIAEDQSAAQILHFPLDNHHFSIAGAILIRLRFKTDSFLAEMEKYQTQNAIFLQIDTTSQLAFCRAVYLKKCSYFFFAVATLTAISIITSIYRY